jgi:mono/diheme cytochrome c family protein
MADFPSLSAALAATGTEFGAPTWCSNPYVEKGKGNARTNCIGCHQHGGSTVAYDLDGDGVLDPIVDELILENDELFPSNGREQLRQLFPADYLWSTIRADALGQKFRSEVQTWEHRDEDAEIPRVDRILELSGDPTAGAPLFVEHCTRCHGAEGMGTSKAPSLVERVPMRSDETIARALLLGKGEMPEWGDDFVDQQIANVFAYLRQTFGAAPE